MNKNRIKIESKDSKGNEKVIYAVRPTKEEMADAQMESNRVFKQALINGAMVRKTLETQLESQGIWNDDKQKQLEEYHKIVRDNLTTIKGGGFKLSEARDLAIKVRIARMEALVLQAEKNEYDSYTAEAQAEAAKIDYLTSVCLKDEKGQSIFKNSEEYRDHQDEPYVIEASQKLVGLIYGVEEGWEADLPENKFLQKYGFVDENLRLVKDGHYITVDGKLINENFQYVDEDGNRVDEDGNKIDEDGLPVVEVQPFLDDDGNPIIESESEENSE